MQKSLLVYCLLLIALLNTIKKCSAQTDLKAYIKPHIGTKGWLFHGRTTPFVAVPFGNTHWTACTAMGRISKVLYHYKHRRILGFRATHKPAMWMGDYGFMQVMPDFENKMPGNLIASARFSHHNEVLQPHYYAVTTHHTHNQKVFTEMSSTATCGFLRFHFSGKENPTLNFRMSNPGNGLGWVKIDTMKQIIFGYNTDRESAHLGPPLPNFKGYFFIRYSQKALAFAYWNQLGDLPGSIECSGDECGVKLVFPLDAKLVEIKVGTSFISLEQAEANLNAEIVSADFEEVKTRSACLWDQHLSSLQIQTNSKKEKEIFYTAMYHSLLFPRKFSEQGRYYSAFDDKVHQGESYNDYSLWDTYRALHPLLLFIAPQHVSGMCNALIQMYREGGYMPKWPNPTYTNIMIGTHADAVLADALVKGVKGIDVKGAYDACMKNAFVPPAGDSVKWWGDRELWPGYEARSGLYWYKKLGYVPVDKTAEAAANTLEGAFDDFCEAQVAGIAGHDSIKQVLEARSKNYRNLFNSQTGFMSPRNADGSWAATKRSGFTEGGPWTYRFAVQHDVPGLIELMGGKEIFVRELRKNFIPLRYWHENEPGHHYAYLFDYAGQSWLTQKMVARYRHRKYRNTPHGLTGDDDCGQMSAWYIFSALGFYPVCPGKAEYALGTPLFKEAVIYPDPGNRQLKLVIKANRLSKRRKYVNAVKLNGVELSSPFISHEALVNGGVLEFDMRATPKKDF